MVYGHNISTNTSLLVSELIVTEKLLLEKHAAEEKKKK